ncbi:hypothetical protein HY469_00905 [Candidatus Roizmanbacteria bacterium]|nr:hypothetical protein [Candidatus Roizmanbacteria bacterium]
MVNDTKKQEPKIVMKGKSIDMTGKKKRDVSLPIMFGIALTILAGIGSGYALSRSQVKGVTVTESGAKRIETDKVVGLLDATFKDEAEGILREGGIEGEGTHHLERDGGPSRYVYLTSSVVPLDDYLDKKVKVWGETNTAEKAGWLMDVGKLELLE